MNQPSEIDRLLEQYKPHDTVVIEALVSNYRTGIYRLAYAMLQDGDEADEALQQTLLKAAASLDRYRPGTHFRSWLTTIAVNVCRGLLRKRKARQMLARLFGIHHNSSTSPADPEQTVLQNEIRHGLWHQVAQLDEKYRLVIVLRFGQEMTVREIAQVLSIPEKTVYTRLYEAFRLLRRSLAAENDEGREQLPFKEMVL